MSIIPYGANSKNRWMYDFCQGSERTTFSLCCGGRVSRNTIHGECRLLRLVPIGFFEQLVAVARDIISQVFLEEPSCNCIATPSLAVLELFPLCWVE